MKGGESAAPSLSDSTFDFLKVLGASLTGITAILTAAGFLAERARLAMLGLPSSTFDLERYAETGALLLGLLPVVMSLALPQTLLSLIPIGLLDAVLEFGFGGLLATAAGAAALFFVWRRWRAKRTPPEAAGSRSLTAGLRRTLRPIALPAMLVAGFLIQVACVGHEVRILDIANVLFVTPESSGGNSGLDEVSAALARRTGETERAGQIFGEIVLFTVINAGLLFYVVRRQLPSNRSGWKRLVLPAWTVVTGLLLVSQITLLPYSYGVLISRNVYPEVCAVLSEDEAIDMEALPVSRLVLVHQTGDGIYLYSRAKSRMWYVPRSAVKALVHYARIDVFAQSDPEPCSTAGQP